MEKGKIPITFLVPIVFDFVEVMKSSPNRWTKNNATSYKWYISEKFVIRETWKRLVVLIIFWGLAWVLIVPFVSTFTSSGVVEFERVTAIMCEDRIRSSWDCFKTKQLEIGISNCSDIGDMEIITCARLGDVTIDRTAGAAKAAGIAAALVLVLKGAIATAFRVLGTLVDL